MRESEFDPTLIELLVGDIGEVSTREVLRIFFEDSTEKLALLGADRCAADIESVRRHAHSLKSAAAAFGFTDLSTRARALEAEASGLTVKEITARVSDLSDALARARGFPRFSVSR